MENALNRGAAYGVDKSGQERRAFGNKNKMPGFLGKLFGLKKPDVPPPGAPAGAAPPATGAFAGGAAGMQQGAMPAMQGNTQQQNQMQPPGPGMAPGPGMMQQQQQPQENIMPGGHNMMGQNQQYNGQQTAPVASNAQFQQQQFQQEDAKINQMVHDSMKTITCQMLDGTTQEYPYIVAKQLEEQGLCKIAPEPAPMANYGAGQGMMYNQENQYSQGMMMNGQQMQQRGFGSAMGMNLPMNSQMGAMADEMVELELPNGEIKMVTKSQAEQMGCIPVPDYPPQQQQQQQALMGANQSGQSGFYNMGGGVPIGPAVIVDQGPEYGRTVSVANINVTQQRQVNVPVQSTMMQPRSTTTTIMPSQQSSMSFNQPQQSMSIMQPQTTTMQRSMTMLQPSMQTTVSVANPMGMAPMPSYDDPVVQVILPSGETQMMPKSQALQLQQQLQAGGGSQAMPTSPGYGVGNAYENQWDGYGGSPPSVPWGQDIGDM